MCILFIARNQSKQYPLIIAANRDEFHKRPTLSSHLWNTTPTLVAGKDQQGGGTWMGVTTSGKIAALTNVRDPSSIKPTAPSRGDLTCNWLLGTDDIATYQQQLKQRKDEYNGYNLVFGDVNELWVYNNTTDDFYPLTDGIFGLSNADIHTSWPKTARGEARMSDIVSKSSVNKDLLFDMLSDQQQAADSQLPETGVGFEWEKRLSSIFITSSEYGTRSSTLLLVDQQGMMHWSERTFNSEGKQTNEQTFALDSIV